jgi:hypothetical protein
MGNHDSYSNCAASLVGFTTQLTIPSKGHPFIMRGKAIYRQLTALKVDLQRSVPLPPVTSCSYSRVLHAFGFDGAASVCKRLSAARVCRGREFLWANQTFAAGARRSSTDPPF